MPSAYTQAWSTQRPLYSECFDQSEEREEFICELAEELIYLYWFRPRSISEKE